MLVLVLGNILADICIVLSAVSGITISSFAVVSSIRAIACIGVIHDFSTVRRQYRITLAVGCHAAIRHRGIRRGGVGFGGIRGAGAVGSLGLIHLGRLADIRGLRVSRILVFVAGAAGENADSCLLYTSDAADE